MKIHELKTDTKHFKDVWSGFKTFEIRNNDREYKKGDVLQLKEYEDGEYSGREIVCSVEYIMHDFEGLKFGYVILSIRVLDKAEFK
jgi:uncharacterized protein YqfB (UPF0267 family)